MAAEHPLEAQLISDFFGMWLNKGYVNKQPFTADGPKQRQSCTWITRYMTTVGQNAWPFQVHGKNNAPTMVTVLSSELGNQAHLDRLALFMKRPNMKKGNVSKFK